MKGVPFPKVSRYRTESRLRDLYNHTIVARDKTNQGGWTNVVCTTDVNLWGSSGLNVKPTDEV